MNYPKKTGFNLYESRHCAYITYSVKTWFLKNLSVYKHKHIYENIFYIILKSKQLWLMAWKLIIWLWSAMSRDYKQLLLHSYSFDSNFLLVTNIINRRIFSVSSGMIGLGLRTLFSDIWRIGGPSFSIRCPDLSLHLSLFNTIIQGGTTVSKRKEQKFLKKKEPEFPKRKEPKFPKRKEPKFPKRKETQCARRNQELTAEQFQGKGLFYFFPPNMHSFIKLSE